MSVQFKVINQNNAGTETKFGGDDLDKTHKWLNGQSGYDPVSLGSAFGVEDGKFFLVYPATGKRVYIRTGAISTDMDWWLPIGTGWITNTLKNIFVNEQIFQKFINFKKITPPANPDVDHITLWADSSSGQIMVKDSSGVAQAIFADIATIANYGTTGVSVFDSKVSSTVYLRSINSLHSGLTASHNASTHAIDLNLVPSSILLETLGGTLLTSQVPVLGTGNLPAAVVLDNENTTLTGLIKLDKQIEMKLQGSHPTPSSGYVSFYAYDDGHLYFKNSSGTLMNILYNTDLDNQVPLPEAGYVTGYWDGTGTQGTGLLNNMQEFSENTIIDYHNTTTGKFAREYGTDLDDVGVGLASLKTNLCYRDANPTLTIDFAVDLAGVPTSAQIFIGFIRDGGNNITEGLFDDDNPLDARDGFMLGKRAADTNYQIIRNDGSGTQVVDNNGLPAPDSNFHTLKIIGDNDNDRWGLQFDAGSVIWKSDDDPIEERELGFAAVVCPEGTGGQLRKIYIASVSLKRKKF